MYRLLYCYLGAFLLHAGTLFAEPIHNGPITLRMDHAPRRAITMNQAATEIMLALGLEDRLIGTAYLDDVILPDFKAAYDAIPVLSARYPTKEIILDSNPDFIYASFPSAFSPKRGLPTREELQAMHIDTYVSPWEFVRDQPWNMELLYQEILEVGKIFHVQERAEALVALMQAKIGEAPVNSGRRRPRILWIDSLLDATPVVGGAFGAPDAIIRLAGGENVFADINDVGGNVSKEQVLDRGADLIVLVDAGWDKADKKREILITDPYYRSIEAVKGRHFVIMPFSAATPGIRIPDAVVRLRAAIGAFQEHP